MTQERFFFALLLVDVLDDGGFQDADVLYGTVAPVGLRLLDHIDDVHTLNDFAEDGVLAVEMGCASLSLIDLLHLLRQFYAAVGSGIETFLGLGKRGAALDASPHDVELGGGRAHFRIDIIAFAGHRHGSATVEELRKSELRGKGVVEIARAEGFAWFGMFAVDVAALDHKVLDDAMEEQRVIDVHLGEFQEVVTMDGRLVVEGDADVARSGLKEHLSCLGL